MTGATSAAYPPALRQEAAVIAVSAGVKEDSVHVEVGPADGRVCITFILETEQTVEAPVADIRMEEPIRLWYENAEKVSITAPSVWSARHDFPRSLGHLNPVPPGSPINFCLARAGLQPIYDRYGIEGILHRLRTWMRDAQTGSLMADGWEPVPYGSDVVLRGGLLNAAAFQEIAAKHERGPGWTCGVAKVMPPDSGDFVVIRATEFSATTPAGHSALAQAVSKEKEGVAQMGVPWLFVWTDRDSPSAEPIFGPWHSYREMREAVDSLGLTQCLDDATGNIFANGCNCVHVPDGRKTLVVLMGVWRPEPIAPNIFGLSEDTFARRLEIRAFSLESDRYSNPINDAATLRVIIADPWPGPDLYRWISGRGTAPTDKLTLIGYGALGSAITDHLIRSGIDNMEIFDPDHVMPHNLARHRADFEDLYKHKVDHAKRAAAAIMGTGAENGISTFETDVLNIPHPQLAEWLGNSKFIVDATADERVRGYLSDFTGSDPRQAQRVEIYHSGRLGVQFVTGRYGSPDLLDLYYSLFLEALTDEAVHQWLVDDHAKGLDSEELLFGFGCSSRSTRLPNFVVAQQAAAFMPKIMAGLRGEVTPGIGLNKLDNDLHPGGWRWIVARPFFRYAPEGAPGWTVRVHPEVHAFLASQRASSLPSETAGYLYGSWDLALKRVIVVVASPLPPNSISKSDSLTLGPSGCTSIERRLARRTRSRLRLCGTWHSHPDDSSRMSAIDLATYSGFANEDIVRGVPTLLVIAAKGGFGVYLRI